MRRFLICLLSASLPIAILAGISLSQPGGPIGAQSCPWIRWSGSGVTVTKPLAVEGGVSSQYTQSTPETISSASVLGRPGMYFVSGAQVITLYDPANYIGANTLIAGDTSGASIWLTQAGSLNDTGTASGASAYSLSAPWQFRITHWSGTCTFIVTEIGNMGIVPE